MNRIEHHGKILPFPCMKDSAAVKKFVASLPKRADFTDLESRNQLKSQIDKQEPILFMPNDVKEIHNNKSSRLEYKILLFGILKDGSKASVVITGIEPFFDLKFPDGIDSFEFGNLLDFIFSNQNNKIYCIRREEVSQYPFKYFSEEPSKYFRLYFRTLQARRRCLEYFLKNNFTYTCKGVSKTVRLQTASDDLSCYYRKAAREYKFELCGWNQISNYEVVNDNTYTKKISVPNTFEVNVKNFINAKSAGIDIQSNPIKYRDYLRDKSLEMSWDLETNGDGKTGNAPDPDFVFSFPDPRDKSIVKEEDTIFMGACSFSWYQDVVENANEPMLVVNFTDMPTPPRKDCLIVQCTNQIEIIYVKCILLERMAPEFVVAFNDGLYDWPFILRRAEMYDTYKGTKIMDFVKKHASCVPWTEENKKWLIRGKRTEQIKIEANMNTDGEFLDVPGFHCIDVRTIFRQLFPTAEKSNLNFYLAANKLGGKEDMPYQTMFKIYRILRILWQYFQIVDPAIKNVSLDDIYDYIRGSIRDLIGKHGGDYEFFKNIGSSVKETKSADWIKKIDSSLLSLQQLTLNDINHLIEKSTDVVHYCNVDARRCHDLLRVRNVIADKREIANLSYTSMFDALYRAGGMKIRNLCMAEGIKPEWNIAFSCITTGKKDERKYPGAFVVPPVKGLYRDHSSVKRRRRSSFQEEYDLESEFTQEDVDPRDERNASQLAELFSSDFDDKYPPDEESNDQNSRKDRPCSGEDFSSLYPSLIMTYNFSPEKAIEDESYMEYLKGKLDRFGRPYRFAKVSFRYGFPDQIEEEKELVEGWFVQHTPIEKLNEKTGKMEIVGYEGMGLLAHVLKVLFDIRSSVKKKMDFYTGPKEYLEKFFEKNPKSAVDALSIEEQKALLSESLEVEKAERVRIFNETGKTFYKWKVKAIEEIAEFFNKEYFNAAENYTKTCVASNITGLYDECGFFFTYYNSKQLGLKVFMNTAYGETGNSLSPFFIKQVAGAITTYGQRNLKFVKSYVESKGWDVKYGDSVSEDTPILVRLPDRTISYKSIGDLSDGDWNPKIYRDQKGTLMMKYEANPFIDGLEVWSDKGWTKIENIVRHFINKRMFRVLTHTGCVDVTEDHSLLDINGLETKPGDIEIGTELLHSELPAPKVGNKFWNAISIEEAKAWGFFYADGSCGRYECKKSIRYSWAINNKDLKNLKNALKWLRSCETNHDFKILNTLKSSGVYKLVPVGSIKNMVEKYRALFYNKNKEKMLPDEIINASPEIQKAFYEGYYIGDGDKDKTQTINRFDNKGKIGAAGLYYINSMMGKEVSINYRFKRQPIKGGVSDIYRLTVSDEQKRNSYAVKKLEELETSEYEMVYDLTTSNHHFAAGIGKMIVHNTDSLYISPPEPYFEVVDKEYETGRITKKDYWTKMIEITMEQMDILSAEIAELLYRDNGTRFLKMAYEEVLFPYAFVGKKKYIGVQHQGIVNLSICMNECTLEEFAKSKLLFVRGLEVKKRGSSEFLKIICYEVIKEAFCITTTKTLKQIVQSKLKELAKRKFKPDLFIKSARYRMPGKDPETGKLKPGNVTVLKFVSRMRALEVTFPDIGIKAPELGERFNYIVSKKYPWQYDLRGRKSDIKVGDKYEYFDSMTNKDYMAIRGENVEIDIDYYIMNEIIGQFARFLTYHPEYDKFYETIGIDDTLSVEEEDERYKKADKKAHNFAKNQLKKYYKDNFAVQYPALGKKYQKIFKETNKVFRSVLEDKYGEAIKLFDSVNTLTTGAEIAQDDNNNMVFSEQKLRKALRDTILEKAKKEAISKKRNSVVYEMSTTKDFDPFKMYKVYVSGPNAVCEVRNRKFQEDLKTKVKELENMLPKFEKICAGYTGAMQSLVDIVKNNNRDRDIDEIEIEDDDIACRAELIVDEPNDYVRQVYEVYRDIVALYSSIEDIRKIKEDISHLKQVKCGRTSKPASIKEDVLKKEFSDWLRNTKN